MYSTLFYKYYYKEKDTAGTVHTVYLQTMLLLDLFKTGQMTSWVHYVYKYYYKEEDTRYMYCTGTVGLQVDGKYLFINTVL